MRHASDHIVLAQDVSTNVVGGYITALSEGVLCTLRMPVRFLVLSGRMLPQRSAV